MVLRVSVRVSRVCFATLQVRGIEMLVTCYAQESNKFKNNTSVSPLSSVSKSRDYPVKLSKTIDMIIPFIDCDS